MEVTLLFDDHGSILVKWRMVVAEGVAEGAEEIGPGDTFPVGDERLYTYVELLSLGVGFHVLEP